MGWRIVKSRVLRDLREGRFVHEARNSIETKNKLATGEVSADFVHGLIAGASGLNHRASPHHAHSSVEVHTVVRAGWYIKFYFLDPDTTFISVHR